MNPNQRPQRRLIQFNQRLQQEGRSVKSTIQSNVRMDVPIKSKQTAKSFRNQTKDGTDKTD